MFGSISLFFFTIQGYALYLNFAFLLMAFIGSLYVAIHSETIPNWIRTPLWYIGCSCFIVAISIVCEWTLGPQYLFSYSRFGLIGQTAVNFFIALTSLIMLIHTVWVDIKRAKLRRKDK